MMNKSGVVIALWLAFTNQLAAEQAKTAFAYIPDTISQEAQAVIRMMPDPNLQPTAPAHNDIEAWKAIYDAREKISIERQKTLLKSLQPTLTEMNLGGVPVLEIKPRNWKDNGKVLVYTHGGAYTMGSAKSTLGSSAVMAEATRLRVISVDYTVAPNAKWQEVMDQVVSVFKNLKKKGYAMSDIAIYGDSAGGGMAAGAVLKMRDQGMGMPAAVVLWSPWSDITDSGDTYVTLKHAEPAYIYDNVLKPSADAYSDPKDQKHPYVSPVYGNYSKGFPPTLIQGGTKEIFLSNFIRHYQVLDSAGQMVKLDLYEGMTHVFQVALHGSPESNIALMKVDAFLKQHLGE